jgi:hypothetical protein
LIAWIGLTGLATLVTFIIYVFSLFQDPFLFFLAAALLSCGLYLFGDFGLAIVSKSMIGTPSDRIRVLYYTYWLVERIPLFTF